MSRSKYTYIPNKNKSKKKRQTPTDIYTNRIEKQNNKGDDEPHPKTLARQECHQQKGQKVRTNKKSDESPNKQLGKTRKSITQETWTEQQQQRVKQTTNKRTGEARRPPARIRTQPETTTDTN